MALTAEQIAVRKVGGSELREIPGYAGLYSASSDGRIWAHGGKSNANLRGKWLRGRPTKDGYLNVAVYKDGVRKDVRAHRLIAWAWLGGPPDPASEINHRNGVKTDNAPSNLEWCDRSHNQRHAWDSGLKRLSDRQRAALALGPKARRLHGSH